MYIISLSLFPKTNFAQNMRRHVRDVCHKIAMVAWVYPKLPRITACGSRTDSR